MKFRMLKWVLAGMCGLLAACAIINVNVYFPEKAVKEAYKSLDDMLLKNEGDKASTPEKKPEAEPAQQPKVLPESAPQPESDKKPQSGLFREVPRISFVAVAQAADKEGDALAVELATMPEVRRAYDEMRRRVPRLNALFANGGVGLSSQGLVVSRDKTKLSSQDEKLISAENASRKVVVTSMARAIVKTNKLKETKANLDQVMGKAANTYSEIKRDAAKAGWWVQLPNGRWIQK